jgi:RNA polymerase sigma-70 factor (ECF subfamily)
MSINLNKHTDLDLISMMSDSKEREELAFSELYDRYESTLRAYIYTIVKNEEKTEDLVQDAFVSFYKQIKKGKEFPNVPGFLITAARNLCLNDKRKSKPKVELNEDYEIADKKKESYEDKELLELVIMATEFLKEKYRRAYILKEFEGYKYREIAKMESIAIATAKVRVLRARKMVINTLEPYIKDLSK